MHACIYLCVAVTQKIYELIQFVHCLTMYEKCASIQSKQSLISPSTPNRSLQKKKSIGRRKFLFLNDSYWKKLAYINICFTTKLNSLYCGLCQVRWLPTRPLPASVWPLRQCLIFLLSNSQGDLPPTTTYSFSNNTFR